jgi:hypothetical protein
MLSRARLFAILAAIVIPATAFAQSALLQGGTWTSGHVPMYAGQGSSQPVVIDSGPAGGGAAGLGLSEQLIQQRGTGAAPYVGQGTGPFGSNWCDYDGPTTGAYHFLCLTPNATGEYGLLSYGAGGNAAAQDFKFNINGSLYSFNSIAGSGIAIKQPVLVATTANVTLSGEQTIDGILTSTSRVLVKDQNTGSQNGIYVTSSGAWTRALDFVSSDQVAQGTQIYVSEGTVNGGTTFAVTNTGTVTPGTTALTFDKPPVGALAAIANNTIVANVSGSSAAPAANTLTQVLDSTCSSTQGSVIYRSGATWSCLPPGTSGNVLSTQGAGQDPVWAANLNPTTVQPANTVYAGPTSGPSATPNFRALVSADIPSSVALAGVPTAPTPGSNIDTTQIANTAWVNNWYAPLASPPLTGTPTAPTAATGTNTSQLATTAFVHNGLTAKAPYVLPNDYNITCDGTTDVAAAFQTMVTASAGKTIFIPAGPACVIGTTITLPSNTTILGSGWGSIIKSTVSGVNPTFSATDVSDIVISNLWIEGTDAVHDWSASSVGAFAYSGSTGAQKNIQLTNLKVSGYNATYWIKINLSGAQILSNVRITNDTFISAAGDIPTSPANGESNHFIAYLSGTAGSLRYSTVSNNYMDANSVCFPLIMFGGTLYNHFDSNIISSPGQTTPSHCNNVDGSTINAYGIALYDLYSNGNISQYFTITGNTIVNPYASGIYLVGGSADSSGYGVIASNNVSGQTSLDNVSLPRAAIAVNDLYELDIVGNSLNGNFGGIDLASIPSGVVNVAGNSCFTSSGSASAHCLRITAATGTSNTNKINVTGNNFHTDSSGPDVFLASSATAKLGGVSLFGNVITAAVLGVSADSNYFNGPFVVQGNTFGGVASGTMMSARSVSGVVTLIGNTFDSTQGTAGAAADVSGSVIAMSGNRFENRNAGVPMFWAINGTCGTISDTSFENVGSAYQTQALSLGTSNPSGCTLKYGNFVQNLTPTEAGTAGSKYVNAGWKHVDTTASTTHVEQHYLTGN